MTFFPIFRPLLNTQYHACMYDLCMPTKTISLDLVAYESLCQLRRDPRESFSKVIRRLADSLGARVPAAAPTPAPTPSPARAALASLFSEADRLWLPSEDELDRLDRHQSSPRPRRHPRDERPAETGG